MQTCIFWSTVRFLLRGRSIVVARRASRDLVEGVAHRRILSKASNVVKDTKSSPALATEESDEVRVQAFPVMYFSGATANHISCLVRGIN